LVPSTAAGAPCGLSASRRMPRQRGEANKRARQRDEPTTAEPEVAAVAAAAAEPAAAAAVASELNSHTDTPWVAWEELRSGRQVVVDGGCTEVVKNDGTPAAGGDHVHGRILQGSEVDVKRVRKRREISVNGTCVALGESRAWVPHRFIVGVSDAAPADVGPAPSSGAAGTRRSSRCGAAAPVPPASIPTKAVTQAAPPQSARSDLAGAGSGPRKRQRSGDQPLTLAALAAAAAAEAPVGPIAPKLPGSHYVNAKAVREAEADAAAARSSERAMARRVRSLETQLAAARQASVNPTEEEGKTMLNAALVDAAKAGDAKAVQRCLRDGADPNATEKTKESEEFGEDGDTALYLAANPCPRDEVGCMEALTAAGANLDKAGWNRCTPLIAAAAGGRTTTVEWLLSHGADWRLTDYGDDGDGDGTALECAKEAGEAEAAAALEAWIAEHGSAEEAAAAKITEEEKIEMMSAALIRAARAGDAEAVRRGLRDGADPNAADGSGRTALYWAALKNQVGCMEVLGEAEADLDKADGIYGETPLMIAAEAGHTAAVEWLLGRGADWRLTRKSGRTALGIAKGRGKAEAAAALETWITEHGSAEEIAEPQRQKKETQKMLSKEGRCTVSFNDTVVVQVFQ